MATGLLFSVFAGFVGQGVIPGAIAAGALAVVWVAVISTVETVEDLSSVVVGRLLERRDPGRVLVVAEAFSLTCALVALAIVLSGGPRFQVFLTFVLVTSVVPLVLDVADELYAGEIATRDRGGALRFNIVLYSIIGLTGSLLARPLGSFLATTGVVIVLIISATASAVAVSLRIAAVHKLRTAAEEARTTEDQTPPHESAETNESAESASVPPDQMHQRIPWRQVLGSLTPGSPLISTLGNLSTAIVSTYVSLWAVTGVNDPNRWLAILFFATGLGATLGPYTARWIERSSTASYLRGMLAARIITLAVIVATAAASSPGLERVAIIAVTMFVLSSATVATAVAQATSRQTEFQGPALAQVVGWSHSGAAAGTLVGTWIGILTGVTERPIVGAAIAAIVAAIALFSVRSTNRLQISSKP